MTDETRNDETQSDDSTNEQASQNPTADELFEEVNRLGARFATALQTAWNSEERKNLQVDIKRGLSSVTSSLEEGFQKASDNEKTSDIIDKADDVMTKAGEKVRSSEVTSELAASLATGLRKVSDQLEKWVNEMENKAANAGDDESGPADEQEIPIDKA